MLPVFNGSLLEPIHQLWLARLQSHIRLESINRYVFFSIFFPSSAIVLCDLIFHHFRGYLVEFLLSRTRFRFANVSLNGRLCRVLCSPFLVWSFCMNFSSLFYLFNFFLQYLQLHDTLHMLFIHLYFREWLESMW